MNSYQTREIDKFFPTATTHVLELFYFAIEICMGAIRLKFIKITSLTCISTITNKFRGSSTMYCCIFLPPIKLFKYYL